MAWLAALLLAAPLFAADSRPASNTAEKPVGRLTAAQLRDRFDKIQKMLDKAQDATDGTDASRVTFHLQRADELIVEFQSGSGLDPFIAGLAAAREAIAKSDYGTTRASLRRAREAVRPLADYTVARPAEVAYRAADQAIEEENPQAFATALATFEGTVLPGYLHDRLGAARAAIARARQAMVRRDMKTGRKEVDAARAAMGRLDYASALSQARYACIVGAELVGANASLTARDQLQDALRQIARALDRAPEADVDMLNAAQADVTEIWRRYAKAQAGDAGRIAKAGDTLETLRLRLH